MIAALLFFNKLTYVFPDEITCIPKFFIPNIPSPNKLYDDSAVSVPSVAV